MAPLEFFDANIPCLAACPVHTNAGLYVAAIADREDELAYLTARLPNPFASVCGRVCAAPCEDACRRGAIDEPIAIRALKRFVTERHGVEAGTPATGARAIEAPEAAERPQSIGIVGGGPTGLSAAHDLRRQGYQVTIYEASDRLGGMMVLGIPEYRLDRHVVSAEIDAIIDTGVEIRFDHHLGHNVTLADLEARHDAVMLAFGATLGRGLDIEGHDADGVFRAIEYLLNVNRGFEVEVGERVLVVGGGDVAMDAARTALRTEAYLDQATESARDRLTEALDAARTAARAGARQVTVMSLESYEEMPAAAFELHEAVKEDIAFVHRRGPKRILVEDGKAVGVETVGVRAVFDDRGNFAPLFDDVDLEVIEADTVILAVGQAVDLTALGANGPATTGHRTVAVDDSLKTSKPMVWAGGDVARGPRTLIEAIADGRRAAASIHQALGGDDRAEPPGTMIELRQFHRSDDHYDRFPRVEVPTIATDRRVGLAEVESGFTEEQARCEAQRCLRCFANILLEPQACVLCGLCADVCPLDLIALVPSEEIGPEVEGATALTLDERACIRCGLCIERCPTDALSMGVWSGAGVPVQLEATP